MNVPAGHASAVELARIGEFEEKLRNQDITIAEQLELALLNLEPLHDGFRAIELLEGILKSAPGHQLAKLWLIYAEIYELMDESSLRHAIGLSDQLLAQGASNELQAAALFLKATALRDLGDDPAVPLRASVALAPAWPSNRQLLARMHEERGEVAAAAEELRKAIKASGERPESQAFADRMFEMLVTARGSHRIADRLEEQLRQIEGPT